jgi:hypothetical protein
MDATREIGETVRYSLASNARTARLGTLMLIAIIALYIWM